ALQTEKATVERELEGVRKKAANAAAGDLLANVKEISGVKVLAEKVEGADAATLRTTLDGIRTKLREGVVVLSGTTPGSFPLLVSVSPEAVNRGIHAGNLLK